jgi:hypothetical protein
VAKFELLTTRKEIKAAQCAFEALMDRALPQRPGTYTIGYHGGSERTSKVRANGNIWYTRNIVRDAPHPRYWNAFGTTVDLTTKSSNDITVEINSPLDGTTRTIGAFFAREVGGGFAVFHTGKIGGGRGGIGKTEFLATMADSRVTVDDPTRPKSPISAFLLARLDDAKGIRGIARFVLAVAKFKKRDRTEAEEEAEGEALSSKQLKAKATAAGAKPKKTLREVVEFRRSGYVSAYAKRRAKGKCDLCRSPAPFHINGKPFLECHHIQRLADGGKDSIDNTVALCPNCHRRMHFATTDAEVERLRKRAQC